MAGERVDPPRLGEHLRAAQHHLRRDAAVVGAFAAEEPFVDAQHGPPGVGQGAGDVLAAGSEAEHDEVEVGALVGHG